MAAAARKIGSVVVSSILAALVFSPVWAHPFSPGVGSGLPVGGSLELAGRFSAASVAGGPWDLNGSVEVGLFPTAIVLDSAVDQLFVANQNSNNVSVVSASTLNVVATVPVGAWPVGEAYDPDTGSIFVVNNAGNTTSVISDTSDRVVATVSVGLIPDAVAYDPITRQIWVAATNYLGSNGTILMLNTTTYKVTHVLKVGADPTGFGYDPTREEFFLSYIGLFHITVLSAATGGTVATIPTTSTGYHFAYDPSRGDMFAVDPVNVSIISDASNKVVDNFSAGQGPVALSLDLADGVWFVSDDAGDTMSVVSDTTLTVTEVIPSTRPCANGFDPVSKNEFVAFCYSYGAPDYIHRISLLGDRYNVTFEESGLPFGSNWSVTCNSIQQKTTSWAETFVEYNGTYPYTVGHVSGYTVLPRGGTLSVDGSNLTIRLTFSTFQYEILFTEAGLPGGSNWSISWATGATHSSNSTIGVMSPNGSFAFWPAGPPGYMPQEVSITLAVDGSNLTEIINFSAVPAAPQAFGPPAQVGIVVGTIGAVAAGVCLVYLFCRKRRGRGGAR